MNRIAILQGILIFLDCECRYISDYKDRATEIVEAWDADVEESSQRYFDALNNARIPFGFRVRIERILDNDL